MFSSPNKKKQKQKTKPPFNALEIVRYAENQHVVERTISPPPLCKCKTIVKLVVALLGLNKN